MYKAVEPLIYAQNYLFHNIQRKANRNKSLFKYFLQAAKAHTQIPAPADNLFLQFIQAQRQLNDSLNCGSLLTV